MSRHLRIALLLVPFMRQDPAPVGLGRPTGELLETFTYISSVRELRNGRVLLSDPRENRLAIADFASNTVRPLTRVGSGPGEYGRASQVHALNGDSSVIADLMSRRWLVTVGDRVVTTLPPDARAVRAVGDEVVMGSDGRGNVISRKRPLLPAGVTTTSVRDSVWVVRIGVASGRTDTVGRVRAARVATELVRNGKGEVITMREKEPNPYAIEEPVAVCADGWLAFIRLDPYRVDWQSPSGAWLRGSPLKHASPRLTENEKRAYMTRLARSIGSAPLSADHFPEWPALIPPVEKQAAFTAVCAFDGTVWVNRAKTIADARSTYDVIDRRGVRVRRVALSASEHVVGFGNRFVYVAMTDDDGVQHLRRYRWP